MSEQNVEVVRRMYEAYVSGDVEGALACCHPDVEADFSVRVDGGVSRGREALNETVMLWVSSWDLYEEEIDEIREFGERVCIAATQRGRAKGSGLELANRFGSLYEVTDGLITRIEMFKTPAEAFEAAQRT
jgi:ketosteroid isomerase-like protein